MSIKKIENIISDLFSSAEVTNITLQSMHDNLELGKWEYNRNGKIRYKAIHKDPDTLVAETEWLEDDFFLDHKHSDGLEIIFVMCGEIHSVHDNNLKKSSGGKISFEKGTIHKVFGKKGTRIIVVFKS